jgi:hypothetical protein
VRAAARVDAHRLRRADGGEGLLGRPRGGAEVGEVGVAHVGDLGRERGQRGEVGLQDVAPHVVRGVLDELTEGRVLAEAPLDGDRGGLHGAFDAGGADAREHGLDFAGRVVQPF